MQEVKEVEFVAKELFLPTNVTGNGEHYSVGVEVGVRTVVIEVDLKHSVWLVYISDGMGGITNEHEIEIEDADRFKKLKGFLTHIVLVG